MGGASGWMGSERVHENARDDGRAASVAGRADRRVDGPRLTRESESADADDCKPHARENQAQDCDRRYRLLSSRHANLLAFCPAEETGFRKCDRPPRYPLSAHLAHVAVALSTRAQTHP